MGRGIGRNEHVRPEDPCPRTPKHKSPCNAAVATNHILGHHAATKSRQRPWDTCFRMGHRVSPNRPATKLDIMFPIPSLQWKKPAIIIGRARQ